MGIIHFPHNTHRPRTAPTAQRKPQSQQISLDQLYPRHARPLRDHDPFFMPILISVIGAVLALSAGAGVLEIMRGSADPSRQTNLEAREARPGH